MALINCPECGKEISDKAASCPNCGAPVEKDMSMDVEDLRERERDRLNDLETQKAKQRASEEESRKSKIRLAAKVAAAEKVKKERKQKTILVIIAVIVVAFLYNSMFGGVMSSKKLTLEKFNQIKQGMTYPEVVDIIGERGEMIAESGAAATIYYTVMYSWEGRGATGANALLTFQGGQLVSKVQTGLK